MKSTLLLAVVIALAALTLLRLYPSGGPQLSEYQVSAIREGAHVERMLEAGEVAGLARLCRLMREYAGYDYVFRVARNYVDVPQGLPDSDFATWIEAHAEWLFFDRAAARFVLRAEPRNGAP